MATDRVSERGSTLSIASEGFIKSAESLQSVASESAIRSAGSTTTPASNVPSESTDFAFQVLDPSAMFQAWPTKKSAYVVEEILQTEGVYGNSLHEIVNVSG